MWHNSYNACLQIVFSIEQDLFCDSYFDQCMFKQIYCFSWVLIIGDCSTICWILISTFFIFCSNKNISFWKAILNIWLILKVIFYQKLRNMQQKYTFKAKYVQICNKNMHLKPKYAKICIYSKICKNMH